MPTKKGRGGKTRKGKSKQSGRTVRNGLPQQTKHSSSYRKELSPSEEVTKLDEVLDGQLVSAGNSGIAEHFYLDSILNTAPGISAIIQGASRQMTAFNYYRVPISEVVHKLYNMESFPMEWIIMFTNLDPGTAFTPYKLLKGNPLVDNKVLGAKGSGQDRQTFKKSVRMAEILGSNNIETADSFRAAVTADPVDFLWYGHAAVCMGGNVMTSTNGVIYQRTVKRTIRWYARAEQSSYVTEVDGVIVEKFQSLLKVETPIKEIETLLTSVKSKQKVFKVETEDKQDLDKYNLTYLHQMYMHYALNSRFYPNALELIKKIATAMRERGGEPPEVPCLKSLLLRSTSNSSLLKC